MFYVVIDFRQCGAGESTDSDCDAIPSNLCNSTIYFTRLVISRLPFIFAEVTGNLFNIFFFLSYLYL